MICGRMTLSHKKLHAITQRSTQTPTQAFCPGSSRNLATWATNMFSYPIFFQFCEFAVWAKVKAAADKLKGDMKDKVKEAIEKYKPKIIDGLNNVKVVVIDAGKKVVIQIRNEIVTIITGAEVAETDLSNAYGIKDGKSL